MTQRRRFHLFVLVCREPVLDHACERTLQDHNERMWRCSRTVSMWFYAFALRASLTMVARTCRETKNDACGIVHVDVRLVVFLCISECCISVSNFLSRTDARSASQHVSKQN